MEKDLKTLTFTLASDIYKVISEMEGGIAKIIADELLIVSYKSSFAASSAKNAISRDRFIRHLEEGYYFSGKVQELLLLLRSVEAPVEQIEDFIERNDMIHRMYGASIKTIQRKSMEARV